MKGRIVEWFISCRCEECYKHDAAIQKKSPFGLLRSFHSLAMTLAAMLLMLYVPVQATELQGGVSFDVNSAREYVQEGMPDGIEIKQASIFQENKTMQKVVYSYNNNGQVIGITVQYKDEPTKAYIYGHSNNLIYIDQYDKPTNIYPHRGYRYNLNGKLILTSLTVSKDEMFRFSPDGKLIAHSINGVIYDENGNIIGSGK